MDSLPREKTDCILCGSRETVKLAVWKGWEVARCRICGLVYLPERPSSRSLEELYGNEYYENGELMAGDTLFVAFNADQGPIVFTLPPHKEDARWERLLDTAESNWGRRYYLRDGKYKLRGRSLVLLRLAGPLR